MLVKNIGDLIVADIVIVNYVTRQESCICPASHENTGKTLSERVIYTIFHYTYFIAVTI